MKNCKKLLLSTRLYLFTTALAVIPIIAASQNITPLIGNNSTNTVDDILDQVFPYPTSGVILGQGWSTYLGQPMSQSCVTGKEDELKRRDNTVSYRDVFDREQLNSALTVSAKASFGSFASGNAEFSKSILLDNSKRNIVAQIDSLIDGSKLSPIENKDHTKSNQLRPEALAILNNKSLSNLGKIDAFYNTCGDSYVVAIQNGARLSAVFELVLNESDVKEFFSISATGSYGMASGSASASSTVSKNKTSSSLTYKHRQEGGPGGVPDPNQPAQVLEKIDAISKAGEGTPLQVVVRSYRRAAGWPKNMYLEGLGSKSISYLAGHRSRLMDLSRAYADAAASPQHYYFPFFSGNTIEDFRSLASKRADSLSSASNCIQNLAMICAFRSSCDIEKIFSDKYLPEVCPGISKFSMEYGADKNEIETLLFGINKPVATREKTSDGGRANVLGVTPVAIKSANNPSLLRLSEQNPHGVSPADIYYLFLAEAPLKRSWGGATYDTRTPYDDTKRLQYFCEMYPQPGCNQIGFDQFAGAADNTPAPPALAKVFQDWVLLSRLMPQAGSFTDTPGHPMRKTQSELMSIASTINVQLGGIRNFTNAPPAPPAPPPPTQKKKLPDPNERICTHISPRCPPQ